MELRILNNGKLQIDDARLTWFNFAGDKFGKEIKVTGLLPNDEAVKMIANMDIIAVPTYFPAEAFPISM